MKRLSPRLCLGNEGCYSNISTEDYEPCQGIGLAYQKAKRGMGKT